MPICPRPFARRSRLFSAIQNGADIAIGSRWLDRSRQVHRQPLYRQFFGRCFNLITRTVMGLRFHDTQCGFKAFTRQAAQTIFQLQTIEGWGFDPEILFIATKRHLRIEEVSVTWGHDERTRISYLRDGFHMLREMAMIRWNALARPIQRPGPAHRAAHRIAMLDLAGAPSIPPQPIVLRITAVAIFFLLLSLLLWRRGHRS